MEAPIGRPREVTRFALYGEGTAAIAPEFVHIERIFDRSSRHGWTIEPHAHPGLMQLLLLQDGTARIASEDQRSDVAGPGVFMVPSGSIHAFRFSRGAEGWVLSLAADLLDDPRLAGFSRALPLRRDAAAWIDLSAASGDTERLGWLLSDLDRRLGEGDAHGGGGDPAVLAQVLLVLAMVSQIAAGTPGGQGADPRGRLAARFRALVEVHYREHWSVEDYAAALGTTRATLTRACGSRFGRAPATIAHDRLLLEARRYLAFTGTPVAAVAEALGFADPAYFARFFKTRQGVSATVYRESRAWDGEALR
ncbi:MAG: hypothetical protein RIS94_2699 [Pseudomonadota bacterium]|jgi:AraC family transcriptional activator of pobA